VDECSREILSFLFNKFDEKENQLFFLYNLALMAWAFFRIGSIFVAFIMFPLILSFPAMKRRWALALPVTREAKSESDRRRVTVLGEVIYGPRRKERQKKKARCYHLLSRPWARHPGRPAPSPLGRRANSAARRRR
jgi:hypothetical protein